MRFIYVKHNFHLKCCEGGQWGSVNSLLNLSLFFVFFVFIAALRPSLIMASGNYSVVAVRGLLVALASFVVELSL